MAGARAWPIKDISGPCDLRQSHECQQVLLCPRKSCTDFVRRRLWNWKKLPQCPYAAKSELAALPRKAHLEGVDSRSL